MNKKIGILLLMITGVLMFTGCGAENVSLNDFVTYEFVGYDGFGGVESSIDYDELQNQVVLLSDEKKNLDDSDVKDLVNTLKDAGAFDGEWSNTETIKNGDTVTYKWSIPDKTVAKFKERTGIKLLTEDLKVKAEGLKDPSEFNVMDYLKIKVEGVAPNGTLKVSKSDDLKNWPKFKYSKKEGLSNDDAITISIGKTPEDLDEFRKANHLPEFEQEISYTVSGMASYITSIDQISEELQEKLKTMANSAIGGHTLPKGEGSLVGLGFCNTNDDKNNMIIVMYKFYDSYNSFIDGSLVENTRFVNVEFYSVTDSEDAVPMGDVSYYNVADSVEEVREFYSSGKYLNYDELQIKEFE